MILDVPVPKDRLCDTCKKNPAVRWFGQTSVYVCFEEKCYAFQQERYDEGLRGMEAQDKFNDELRWWKR